MWLFYMILGFALFQLVTSVDCQEARGRTVGLKCGGIINQSTGRISYKLFATVAPNEVCVWIIRYPEVRSVTIYGVTLGVSQSLTFTSLGHQNQRQDWTPKTNETTQTMYNTNVLIVTLTDVNATVGFGFEFKFRFATHGGRDNASDTSESVIIANDFGVLNYPAQTSNLNSKEKNLAVYGNRDLSVFVFVPTGRSSLPCKTEINVVYQELSIHGKDHLDVLTYDKRLRKWIELGQITEGNSDQLIRGNDLLMLVFRADESIVGNGFKLVYTQTSTCDVCQ